MRNSLSREEDPTTAQRTPGSRVDLHRPNSVSASDTLRDNVAEWDCGRRNPETPAPSMRPAEVAQGLRGALLALVESRAFDALVSVVIVTNSITIGVQVRGEDRRAAGLRLWLPT